MLVVKDIQYHIPKNREPVTRVQKKLGLSDPEMKVYTRLYGLREVPVYDGPLEELMISAISDLQTHSAFNPLHIRYVIHCHTSQLVWPYMRSLPMEICRKMGFKRALGFGMTASNCATVMVALQTMETLLAQEQEEALGIVIVADQAFSKTLRFIPNTTMCGDAAAAVLLAPKGAGSSLLAIEKHTYGRHCRGVWQTREEAGEFDRTYPERLAGVMQAALDKCRLNWDDIKMVFPHNVNLFSWQRVAKTLGIPFSKIFLDLLPETGHCFGADMLFNWAIGAAQKKVHPGDQIMIATAGLGAVFSAAVFTQG